MFEWYFSRGMDNFFTKVSSDVKGNYLLNVAWPLLLQCASLSQVLRLMIFRNIFRKMNLYFVLVSYKDGSFKFDSGKQQYYSCSCSIRHILKLSWLMHLQQKRVKKQNESKCNLIEVYCTWVYQIDTYCFSWDIKCLNEKIINSMSLF